MNARILLVDDDTALLDALPEALRLRMNGIQIDTSETAVDALERIKQTDYDAIVSDVKMPGMDGLALLHEIRELRPSTPTLMITGHGERELAVQALRGGAYDFVQKPIDRDYFIASLERAIQRRVLDRQVEEQRLALERHARVREHEERKGEFIATVSHELRTPLAAIYGSAQTLLREDIELDESGQKRLLDVIAQESERLSRIADDILFANKLDSGQFVLGEKRIDLLALAREVVDQMRACFASRDDISIDLAVPATIDSLVGDSDKLRQVLINLIDNAVKYSPDGGRIDVAVEARDGGVRSSIRDEGIGMAPLELRRIFGKFYRVDPALTRGVGGTGLGLYICRELVRRMEGRLSVRSEEGKGSTFIVELPVQAAGDSDR